MELFAASLAAHGIPAVLFSGCPVACAQARERIPGIRTIPIDKTIPPESLDVDRWRRGLAQAAAESLTNVSVMPYRPDGPFHAEITIRDGAAAAPKMADPWGFKRAGATVRNDADDIHTLYTSLIRLCYLPPHAEKTLPYSRYLYNLIGRLGRIWARRQLANGQRH